MILTSWPLYIFIFYFAFRVPNAVDGHDSPELEIYCMDGVPEEDLQRHFDGLPIVPYTKSKMIIGDASILPILAAQKASVAAQLAESKNMTVIGDLVGGILSPTGSGGSVGMSGGSSSSVVSPPLPAVSVSAPSVGAASAGQAAADYWNNPYVMAAYYQQQQQLQYPQGAQYQPQGQGAQYPQYGQPQGPQYNQQQQYAQQQAYAQYYQAYAQYYNQQSIPTPVIPIRPEQVQGVTVVDNVESGPLIIPAYVDPNTNKMIPGTIFTVLNLDRSMEELRAEMKRYRKIQ